MFFLIDMKSLLFFVSLSWHYYVTNIFEYILQLITLIFYLIFNLLEYIIVIVV